MGCLPNNAFLKSDTHRFFDKGVSFTKIISNVCETYFCLCGLTIRLTILEYCLKCTNVKIKSYLKHVAEGLKSQLQNMITNRKKCHMALKFSFGRRNFIEKLSKVVRFFSENYF
jgi:hypothetical protein